MNYDSQSHRSSLGQYTYLFSGPLRHVRRTWRRFRLRPQQLRRIPRRPRGGEGVGCLGLGVCSGEGGVALHTGPTRFRSASHQASTAGHRFGRFGPIPKLPPCPRPPWNPKSQATPTEGHLRCQGVTWGCLVSSHSQSSMGWGVWVFTYIGVGSMYIHTYIPYTWIVRDISH